MTASAPTGSGVYRVEFNSDVTAEAVLAGSALPPGPVVISAPATRFDFDTLEQLAGAGVRSGRAFGLLPTDLHPPAASLNADGLWYHVGSHAQDSPRLDPAGTLAELARSWTLLSVFGHGDGMHINMDGVVLCGVVGEHEQLDGSPLAGGCSASTGHCKKQRVLSDIQRARDLRCHVLLLLSCNSLALSRQLYPSDNSIAVAAWTAGAAQAVIGTTRQTEFAPQEAEEARQRILSGAPLGDVVRQLNSERLADGRDGFYILLGDPQWRAPAVNFPPTSTSPPRKTEETLEPGAPRLHARDLLGRVADGRRLTTAMRILCRFASSPSEADHRLRRLESLRHALEQRIWTAVAHGRINGFIPETAQQRLMDTTATWQDSCCTVLVETGLLAAGSGGHVGDQLSQALGIFAAAETQSLSDTTCDRCGGRVLVRPLRFPNTAPHEAPTRVALECTGCGPRGNIVLDPVAHTGDRLPTLSAIGSPAVRKGTEVTLSLRYSTTTAAADVPLLVQVRDKSRSAPLPEARYVLPAGSTTHTVSFPIPADSGSDIFSARAVIVRGGSLEILRCVFPVY